MSKKIFASFFSAVIGGAMVLGMVWYTGFPSGQTVKIEHVPATVAKNILNRPGADAEGLKLVDFSEVAEHTMPAVVHIKSTQTVEAQSFNRQYQELPSPFRFFFDEPNQRRFEERNDEPQVRMGSGSGVIINSNGYIITNNHVIDNANDIEVVLHDNRTYKAMVIGTDPSTDLALLQIKESGLPTIPFVNSDEVRVGEWVMAVGNPFNLNSTVTAGIVSAKGRNINILRDRYAVESFIQTDAAINPGNSGGALVNMNGGLIGINTAISSPTGSYAGYGFAVPSNIVNKVVEDILKYGAVHRGYLGVLIRGVNSNLAKEKGLDVNDGVYVDSLMDNSAAKDAGIKQGDVIMEVNGSKIKSAPELQEAIARYRPGDEINMTVDRFGKMKEFKVELKGRDGENEVVAAERSKINAILGADFEELDKDARKKLNLESGIVVKKLYPGKLKQYTDMKEGFIITKVDGKQVGSLKDFSNMFESKDGGVMLEGIYKDSPGKHYYAFGM